MKITVEFDSLEEFDLFRGNNTEADVYLSEDFHKDIKDIDDLATEENLFDRALYAEVQVLLDRVEELDDPYGNNRVEQILYETTGDYELTPVFSNPALNRIKKRAESLIHSME